MEEQATHSFDRGVNYEEIKEKLIKSVDKYYNELITTKKKLSINRLTYSVIGCIQLRNACRISEAVKAFILFFQNGINKPVTVKISKSDAIKKTKEGTKKKMKARFRDIVFPCWFNNDIFNKIKNNKKIKELIEKNRLKKRVLDHLLYNFNCNTHSLRYSCINYLLYEKKRPINDVASYAGHCNVNQIVRYTQKHRVNEIRDDKDM